MSYFIVKLRKPKFLTRQTFEHLEVAFHALSKAAARKIVKNGWPDYQIRTVKQVKIEAAR